MGSNGYSARVPITGQIKPSRGEKLQNGVTTTQKKLPLPGPFLTVCLYQLLVWLKIDFHSEQVPKLNQQDKESH